MARRAYTEEEKKQYVRGWQASVQSAAVFAAQKGIKKSTFYKWLAKAKKRTPNSSGGFVEVSAVAEKVKGNVEENSARGSGRLFIRAKGVEIEIDGETAPERLGFLIKVMAAL